MSDLQVCSSALILIGSDPITSFEEGTTEAITARQIYEPAIAAAMGSHPWRFCQHQVQLSRLVEKPARHSAAYQLPADLIELRAVHVGGRPIPFDRYNSTIHCDAGVQETVIADYVRRVPTVEWPASFRQAMIYHLASLFAVPVAGQPELSATYEGMFEKQLARSKGMMAQGTRSPAIRANRFTGYR
jgi:hypothetical protein